MRNIDALQNLFSKLLLCCIGSNHKSWPFLFAILLMASSVAQATTQGPVADEVVKKLNEERRDLARDALSNLDAMSRDSSGGLEGSAGNSWMHAGAAAASSAATAVPLLAQCPVPAQCIAGSATVASGIMQLTASLAARSSRNELRDRRGGGGSGDDGDRETDVDLTRGLGTDIIEDDPAMGGLDSPAARRARLLPAGSALLDGVQDELEQLQQSMHNNGYSYNADDDTLTTPHGTFPIDQINSLDKMQKAGLLSAADRPAAEAALKAAQEKGRRRAEKFLKAARKEARSGRSSIKSLKFNKPKAGLRSSFYFQGKKKLSGPRKALSRNIAGEQVGVSSDGLFYMIHRKYQTQSKELLKR